MKPILLSLLLVWQIGSGPTAQIGSRHLRYERPLTLPSGAAGQACVTLDGSVFAHTEATGAGDVRIYANDAGHEFEVPFALLESGPNTLESQPASVRNAAAHDNALTFDLAMPSGEYSEVDLDLNAKNFAGVAQVSGVDNAGHVTALGSFTLFDFSGQDLARSTVLSLRPSTYPVLHVELRQFDGNGSPMHVDPAMIVGATVPPSRQEQTIYTTVASSSGIEQQGHWTTAVMIVPAHVPIERARFVLKDDFQDDFLRDATIAASPMQSGLQALGAAEGVSGHIFRVSRAALGAIPPIDSQVLSMDTVIGANLRAPAKITASVDNGNARPLPLERVDLQMRQRRLCFEAQPSTRYTLRYGDADLSAPSYRYARRFTLAASPIAATLGPETKNPGYIARSAEHQDNRAPEELPWVLAIAAIVIAGVTTLQFVRHRREEIR